MDAPGAPTDAKNAENAENAARAATTRATDRWVSAGLMSVALFMSSLPVPLIQHLGVVMAVFVTGSWIAGELYYFTGGDRILSRSAPAPLSSHLPSRHTLEFGTREEQEAAFRTLWHASSRERDAVLNEPLFRSPEEREATRRQLLAEIIDTMRKRTEPHYHYSMEPGTLRDLHDAAGNLGFPVPDGLRGDAHVPLALLTPAHAHYVATSDSALAAALRSVFHTTPAEVAAHQLLVEKNKVQ